MLCFLVKHAGLWCNDVDIILYCTINNEIQFDTPSFDGFKICIRTCKIKAHIDFKGYYKRPKKSLKWQSVHTQST